MTALRRGGDAERVAHGGSTLGKDGWARLQARHALAVPAPGLRTRLARAYKNPAGDKPT